MEKSERTLSQIKRTKSEERARIRSFKMYYESKIACISNPRLHPDLILLACKDAPVEKGNMSSSWQRKRYIKKCLKFFDKKLKKILKQEKKLDGKFFLF